MRKTTLLALLLMLSASASLMADVAVPYGEGAGQADIINYKKYPKCDDPQPTGPLSFRVVGEDTWVADSVRSKLMKFGKDGKFVSEFNTYPSDDKAFFTETIKDEKLGETKLPVLLRTIDDFAPVYGEDGKLAAFWVADSCKNMLTKFAVDGTKLAELKHPDFGQLYRVEVGKGGHIFVADKVARAIFTFDKDGKFLNKVDWEWSGFAVSGADDKLYRLTYDEKTKRNSLVVSTLDGKVLSTTSIQPLMFDPRLWWVDEEKAECVITYSQPEFKGFFNIVRVYLDGKTLAEGEMPAPIIMNRIIENRNGEVFIGKCNYFDAPEGQFEVVPFTLPEAK